MSNSRRHFLHGVSYVKGDPGHMFISTMKKKKIKQELGGFVAQHEKNNEGSMIM